MPKERSKSSGGRSKSPKRGRSNKKRSKKGKSKSGRSSSPRSRSRSGSKLRSRPSLKAGQRSPSASRGSRRRPSKSRSVGSKSPSKSRSRSRRSSPGKPPKSPKDKKISKWLDSKQNKDGKTKARSGPKGCSMCWKNITYTVKTGKCCKKEKKILLNRVSGYLARGGIMALMGPSGSGKTTLLDVLADRVSSGQIEGEVYVNGKPRDSKIFRFITSYVSVEEEFYEIFTVKETVTFAAHLSLPKVPKKERKKKVARLLKDCGMESCANTRIGGGLFRGLSSGQLRRLNICLELIKMPMILFMDEPLSGLDGAAATNMMKLIRDLSKKGMTIFMSVHQPPSKVWAYFDSLTLMSRGLLMYCGRAKEVLDYMKRVTKVPCPRLTNPPDYFIDLINTDFDGHADIQMIALAYKKSKQNANIRDRINMAIKAGRGVDKDRVRKRCNYFKQTLYLTKRSLLNTILHPGAYWLRLGVYIFLTVIVATMFVKTNKDIKEHEKLSMIFFVQSFLIMLTIATLSFLLAHRPVFIKERSNGLVDTGPYAVSVFVGMVPGVAIVSLVVCLIIVFITGLNNFGMIFMLMFAVLLVSEMFMYVIAAISKDDTMGVAIAAAVFGCFMVSCGFVLSKSRIPDYWIWLYYLAFHTYAFRGVVKAHYEEGYKKNPNSAAGQILKTYDMVDIKPMMEVGILGIYLLCLFFVFVIIMQFKHTGRK